MDAAARIEGLEAENERLRARVRELEQAAGGEFVAPLAWGLTTHETRVFGVLMVREIASKEQILDIVYDDPLKDKPAVKIVDVFVCKIRRKLEPFGVGIETLWGRGYFLTPETKAAVKGLLAGGAFA